MNLYKAPIHFQQDAKTWFVIVLRLIVFYYWVDTVSQWILIT
jgi:hypothetical protein